MPGIPMPSPRNLWEAEYLLVRKRAASVISSTTFSRPRLISVSTLTPSSWVPFSSTAATRRLVPPRSTPMENADMAHLPRKQNRDAIITNRFNKTIGKNRRFYPDFIEHYSAINATMGYSGGQLTPITIRKTRKMKRQGLRKASVTIRDVARESGFAASTVSIVLNNA